MKSKQHRSNTTIEAREIIGKKVRYFDYLGLERFGNIIAIEPYSDDENVVYVYIEDDDPEFNIHQDSVQGQFLTYADIRLSTEVSLEK